MNESSKTNRKLVTTDRKIITLCGSMKFFDLFIEKAKILTMNGYIVLLPFPFPENNVFADEDEAISCEILCSNLMIEKIKMADIVLVINKDGYIGENTEKNIKYAKEIGKEIRYIEQNVEQNIEKIGDVITLCGSMRFKELFKEIKNNLVSKGKVVLTPEIFDDPNPPELISEEQHEMYDKIHKKKIDLADVVYCINKGGYIGEDTMKEIEYAHHNGKHIEYLENSI